MDASLTTLVYSIGSASVMAMGLAPNPQTGQTSADFAMARFNIDLLAMLEEKTRGNRTGDEDKLLQAVLQDLRLKFIQTQNSNPAAKP